MKCLGAVYFFHPKGAVVHKQLHFLAVAVDPNRNRREKELGEVPALRNDMNGRLIRPIRLVDVVGVLGKSGQIDDAKHAIADRPVKRETLAKIIKPGPSKLTCDPRRFSQRHESVIRAIISPKSSVSGAFAVILDVLECHCEALIFHDLIRITIPRREVGCILRADEGLFAFVFFEGFEGVILAIDIQRCRDAIFLASLWRIAGRRDRTAGVVLFANHNQTLGNHATLTGKILFVLFIDFISHAPEDHAGMVAVAADHADQIPLMPLLEILMVVIAEFFLFPDIEGLIHDHEAHAVAHRIEFRLARIVTRADGVAAHLAQDFELTLQGPVGNGGPKRAEVVVHTNAFNIDAFPVQ